jgi:hypothetical protein
LAWQVVWWLVDEAFRGVAAGTIEGLLAGGVDGISLAVVNLVRGHDADPSMMVVLVVAVEELAAGGLGILDAAEPTRKARLVLQGLQVAIGEGDVVRGVWPVVRAGDAEIGEQAGGGLGLHRSTTIDMQGQLAGHHLVLGDSVLQQRLEEGGSFAIGDAPADTRRLKMWRMT